VKAIKEQTGLKANDTKALVNVKALLEKVKNEDKAKLMVNYKDMIEWLMMLCRNPRQRQVDDNIKPITLAYSFIDEMNSIIDSADRQNFE
jgi:hypothetical protein